VPRRGQTPTLPPVQCVPGVIFPGVKRSGRESHHSTPFSAKIKMRGAILVIPYIFMAWCLVKHRDNFVLYCFTYFIGLYVHLLLTNNIIYLNPLQIHTAQSHKIFFLVFS